LLLTFEFGDDFSRINLKLDCCLNETWVILNHLLVSLENKVFLNKVADIMQPGCSNIATCSLQTMREILHFLVIVLLEGDNDILHSGIESHALKIAQHHVEDLRLSSKTLDS
jgi:hypothetical protein